MVSILLIPVTTLGSSLSGEWSQNPAPNPTTINTLISAEATFTFVITEKDREELDYHGAHTRWTNGWDWRTDSSGVQSNTTVSTDTMLISSCQGRFTTTGTKTVYADASAQVVNDDPSYSGTIHINVINDTVIIE